MPERSAQGEEKKSDLTNNKNQSNTFLFRSLLKRLLLVTHSELEEEQKKWKDKIGETSIPD